MDATIAANERVETCIAGLAAGGSSEQRGLIARALNHVYLSRAPIERLAALPIQGGLSGAGVLLVDTASGGTADIPLIVKFGAAELIEREIWNYRHYVVHKLRTAPRLLHSLVEGQHGVVLFELAGTVKDVAKLQTLRSYFDVRKDTADVGPGLLYNALQDLRSWHDGVFLSRGRLVDALTLNRTIPSQPIRQYDQVLREFDAGLQLVDLQLAWEALQKRWPFDQFHTSVQHADLNVGNIIIDLESHWSYIIDFGSVKPAGPVFGDAAKVMREVMLRLHSVGQSSRMDYLRGLESLFSSLRIFFDLPKSRRQLLHDLPHSFEAAFSLSMNFGPWCRNQIAFIEARCGPSSSSAQLTVEFFATLLFQCLLLLLPSDSGHTEETLGAVYACHVILEILSVKVGGFREDLQAIVLG